MFLKLAFLFIAIIRFRKILANKVQTSKQATIPKCSLFLYGVKSYESELAYINSNDVDDIVLADRHHLISITPKYLNQFDKFMNRAPYNVVAGQPRQDQDLQLCPRFYSSSVLYNDRFYCCGGYEKIDHIYRIQNNCIIHNNTINGLSENGGETIEYNESLDIHYTQDYDLTNIEYTRYHSHLNNIRVMPLGDKLLLFNETDAGYFISGSTLIPTVITELDGGAPLNTTKVRVSAYNKFERLMCENTGTSDHFICILEHNQFEIWSLNKTTGYPQHDLFNFYNTMKYENKEHTLTSLQICSNMMILIYTNISSDSSKIKYFIESYDLSKYHANEFNLPFKNTKCSDNCKTLAFGYNQGYVICYAKFKNYISNPKEECKYYKNDADEYEKGQTFAYFKTSIPYPLQNKWLVSHCVKNNLINEQTTEDPKSLCNWGHQIIAKEPNLFNRASLIILFILITGVFLVYNCCYKTRDKYGFHQFKNLDSFYIMGKPSKGSTCTVFPCWYTATNLGSTTTKIKKVALKFSENVVLKGKDTTRANIYKKVFQMQAVADSKSKNERKMLKANKGKRWWHTTNQTESFAAAESGETLSTYINSYNTNVSFNENNDNTSINSADSNQKIITEDNNKNNKYISKNNNVTTIFKNNNYSYLGKEKFKIKRKINKKRMKLFHNELKVMSLVQSPNTVKVVGYCLEESTIIFDWYPKTLAQAVLEESFDEKMKIKFIKQLLMILDKMHSIRPKDKKLYKRTCRYLKINHFKKERLFVTHNDMHAKNIFIDIDNNLCLADFGRGQIVNSEVKLKNDIDCSIRLIDFIWNNNNFIDKNLQKNAIYKSLIEDLTSLMEYYDSIDDRNLNCEDEQLLYDDKRTVGKKKVITNIKQVLINFNTYIADKKDFLFII